MVSGFGQDWTTEFRTGWAVRLSELTIGRFVVRSLERHVTVEGETASGVASSGRGVLFQVDGPGNLQLTVRDTRWDWGERDVVASERHGSPERFDTLVERLRLTVLDRGGPYIELRQARLRSNGRAGLFDANLTALGEGAGIDVQSALLTNGAEAIGTREELLGDVGRTRLRIGARVSMHGDARLPVVAYVLTRVAPVANGVSA